VAPERSPKKREKSSAGVPPAVRRASSPAAPGAQRSIPISEARPPWPPSLLRKLYDQIGPLPYNWDVLTEEDKQWISQRSEKVETTLLTEFHKWASPVELRQRSHAAVLRALDTEVESLSDRLKNLEGR
jgi:hypothetical protein